MSVHKVQSKKSSISNLSTKVILIFIIVFLLIISFVGFEIYNNLFSPQTNVEAGSYSLVIELGNNFDTVGNTLARDEIIKTSMSLKYFVWTTNPVPLQTGEYLLKIPATPKELLDQINKISIEKRQMIIDAGGKKQISITFKEGLTMDQYIDLMDKNGLIERKEFVEYSKNPANFDRKTYSFLPQPLNCSYGDVSKCAKYYPEGYFFPDTYSFFLPSTPAEIYSKVFDNFNRKIVQPNQNSINFNDGSFQRNIIIASMIERETGRPGGVTTSNIDDLNQERKLMASVFENRLDQGIKIESDPTVTYGTGKTVCQSTFEIKNCVYLDDPAVVNNKYNTYRIPALPIGPVTSPSISSINAVFEPVKNDNLFFVSDITGKKYFAKTFQQHENNIKMVQKLNAELSSGTQ